MTDLDSQFDLITRTPKRHNPGVSAFFGVLTFFAIAIFIPATIAAWRYFL